MRPYQTWVAIYDAIHDHVGAKNAYTEWKTWITPRHATKWRPFTYDLFCVDLVHALAPSHNPPCPANMCPMYIEKKVERECWKNMYTRNIVMFFRLLWCPMRNVFIVFMSDTRINGATNLAKSTYFTIWMCMDVTQKTMRRSSGTTSSLMGEVYKWWFGVKF